MLARCLAHLRHLAGRCLHMVGTQLSALTKPATPSLAGGVVTDLLRSKQDLVLENALLRQQLLVLNRSVKRPALTPTDRGLLVLLASWLRTWASALVIVQPETVLSGGAPPSEPDDHHQLGARLQDANTAPPAAPDRALRHQRRADSPRTNRAGTRIGRAAPVAADGGSGVGWRRVLGDQPAPARTQGVGLCNSRRRG